MTYAVSYFLPIILRDTLGFSVAESQCLTAPCYVFSFLLGFTESWISDRYTIRGHIIVFNCILQIIGVAVLGFASQAYVRYFGAYVFFFFPLFSDAVTNPATLRYRVSSSLVVPMAMSQRA